MDARERAAQVVETLARQIRDTDWQVIASAIRAAESEALERAAREIEGPLGTCVFGENCPRCEAIRCAAKRIRALKDPTPEET